MSDEFKRTVEGPYFYPGLAEDQMQHPDNRPEYNELEQSYAHQLGRPLTKTERRLLHIDGNLSAFFPNEVLVLEENRVDKS